MRAKRWRWMLAGLLAGAMLAPLGVSAESYDYQDYRDAGYFNDGFYDDDWFYDWYDTGFYDGDDERDLSQYYDDAGEKGLFDF